jgi:hypothetical protein
LNICRGTGSRYVRAECRHCKPRDALPVQLHGADLRIKEYPAQDIALLKGKWGCAHETENKAR